MKTLAIAVGTVFTALAPAAFAQAYDRDAPRYYDRDAPRYYGRDDRDTARVIDSHPVYSAESSRQECWNPRAGHYEELRDQGSTHVGKGAAIGAVTGGVVGHQVGSGNGNTAATVGGAVLGGILGHQIEKRNDQDDQPDLDKSRCRPIGTADAGRVEGYEVRYAYRGQEYVTRMDHPPGSTLVPGRDISENGRPY
jgi:uncharacterized protein YcfJ